MKNPSEMGVGCAVLFNSRFISGSIAGHLTPGTITPDNGPKEDLGGPWHVATVIAVC